MTIANTEENEAAVGPQVPTGKRILWGLGGITDCLIYNGLNGLVDQIYTIALALDPKWVGIARSVPRFLDFVTDPLVGHLSDNTRSRWGRRKPWMLAGVAVSAGTGVLMWYPPRFLGPTAVHAFIIVMLALLFTVGYALFTIPYTAMGYEMSRNSDERTHIYKYRILAFTAVGFVTPWLARLCLQLEGPRAEVLKGLEGIHWVSLVVAAAIVVSGLCPILFCRDICHGRAEQKVSFAAALGFTVRNRAFWPVVLSNFFAKFGMSITGIFFYYLFIYRIGGSMKGGATEWGWFVTAITVATLAGTPLIAAVSERLGKKLTVIGLMAGSAAAYASVWWTFQPHYAGIKLYLATGIGIGIFCNTIPIIVNSMLADVCDLDELQSGHRREAFYGAVFVTCDKVAMAVTLFLQGFLLSASGFDATLEKQAAETVDTWMRWLLMTQPTGLMLGMLCVLAYPLTKPRLQAVQRQLLERRQPT
jgi:glycoside/pentoside/hexuronide:cation symporter, GPH family